MLACTDVCYTPSSLKAIKFQVIAQGLWNILIVGTCNVDSRLGVAGVGAG